MLESWNMRRFVVVRSGRPGVVLRTLIRAGHRKPREYSSLSAVGENASEVSGHQRQLARAPNPATSYAPARADARAESRTVRRDEDESPRSPSRPLRARVARTVPIRVPRVPASRTPRTRHPHARCRRIFGDEG